MKNHAIAVAVATAMRRPPRLTLSQRKRCIFPPPCGKYVDPPKVYDFRDVIEAAECTATWTPSLGICVAPAFEAAGF